MLFLDRRNQITDIHTAVFPFMLQNYPESRTLGMKAEE